MSNDPQYRGSCLCGASQYSVTGKPIQAVICHCTNCKKWSGGAFAANVWVSKDSFKLDEEATAGIKTYADSNTDTGNILYRVSCGQCGSSLYIDVPSYGIVSVTRGTLDIDQGTEQLNPATEFYCSRKILWAVIDSKTEQLQKL